MECIIKRAKTSENKSHNILEDDLYRLPLDRVSVVDYYQAFVDATVLPKEKTLQLFKTRQDGLQARKELSQGVAEGAIKAGDVGFAEMQDRIQAGHEAEGKIIKHNLRLVVDIAANQARKYPHYRNSGVLSFSDLVQEGIIGLKRAVEKYDVDRGTAFSTYATPWVKKTITTSIIDNFHALGITKARVSDLAKAKRVQDKYLQEENRTPTKEEILEETGVREEDIDEVLVMASDTKSLDEPLKEDESSRTLGESMESDVDVEEAVDTMLEEEDLMLGIILLEPKERKVLIYRYAKGMTLEEIGDKLGGITKEGIRYIQNKALEKLKDILLKPGYIQTS